MPKSRSPHSAKHSKPKPAKIWEPAKSKSERCPPEREKGTIEEIKVDQELSPLSKRKTSVKKPHKLLKIFERSARTTEKLWGPCWQNVRLSRGRMVSMFAKQWISRWRNGSGKRCKKSLREACIQRLLEWKSGMHEGPWLDVPPCSSLNLEFWTLAGRI